jgi:plasmid stabilization system protein ParE
MAKLALSPLALQDLLDVKEYIEDELQNPQAAADIVAQIVKRLGALRDFPNMGAPLASIIEAETGYRYLVCGSYTAFYRYDDGTAYIARVLYGRRDFMRILFGETGG